MILPTPRGWMVMISGAAWLLVAAINHLIFAFLLALISAALSLASLISALLSLRGLRVERGTVGNAATGQAVSMPLKVTNTLGRRRQPIVIIEEVPFSADGICRTVVPSLSAREERQISRRMLAMHRGIFDLRPIYVRGGDPAGLFRSQKRLRLPRKVLVVPGTESVPNLLLKQRETVLSTTGNPISAAGMSQDFYGVREYTPTDGRRYIHWPSSARSGRLMVREFEHNAVLSAAVLLDAEEHFVSGAGPWSNLEYQIRAAASLCKYCSGLYCDFALAAGGRQALLLGPKPASEIQPDVLFELATLQPGSTPLDAVAYDLVRQLPRETVVFCLSLSTSRALSGTLSVLREQGMTVHWSCARRQAFEPKKTRSAGFADGDPVPVLGQLEPAQLHPGMPLTQVFGAFT